MKTEKGFSLFELAVVIGIISVLYTIAIPSILNWKINAALQGNARMFAADLQKIKTNAIKLNCPVVILLSDNGYKVFEGQRRRWSASGRLANKPDRSRQLVRRCSPKE